MSKLPHVCFFSVFDKLTLTDSFSGENKEFQERCTYNQITGQL